MKVFFASFALICVVCSGCNPIKGQSTLKRVERRRCAAQFAQVGGGYRHLMPNPGYPQLYFVFASWSDDSQRVASRIQQLYMRYHSRGLQVVGISVDHQSRVFAETFTDVSGITFDVVRVDGVTDPSLTRCLGPTRGIPKVVLIGPQGRVLHHTTGTDSVSSISDLLLKVPSIL